MNNFIAIIKILVIKMANLEPPCAGLVFLQDSHPILLTYKRQHPPHPVMSLIRAKSEYEYRALPSLLWE